MSKQVSVQSTYDSLKDGLQYTVSTAVNGKNVSVTKIADPFISHKVNISLKDSLLGLLKGGVKVDVNVYSSLERMEDVLELDDQYIGADRTRKQEFNVHIQNKINEHITRELGEA